MIRSKTRSVLLLAGALLALSALAASGAQAAVEGPFYKITGSRLLSGESKEVKLKATSTEFRLNSTAALIICKSQGVAKGAKLLGSSGANSATGELKLELSECEVRKNGEGCTLAENRIVSEPLKSKLVYMSSTRSGGLGVDIGPVTGSKLASLHWNETKGKCLQTPERIEGSVIAYLYSGGKPVEVGKEPAAAAGVELNFKFGPPRGWWEEGGTLKEAHAVLRSFFGVELIAEGESMLELTTGSTWGVFT